MTTAIVKKESVIPALSVGKFTVTPTGLILNGEPEWKEWEVFLGGMQRVHAAVNWVIGDALQAIENQYGENGSQMLGMFPEYEYKTLLNYRYVVSAIEFSRRRESLSFTHHSEVAALSPAQQNKWLAKAEKKKWSVKELSGAIRDAKLLNRPSLPNGIYNVMLADPPWEYGPENPQGGPVSLHYPSMSIEELCEMELPEMDKNSVLFMWVTNAMLKKAFMVLEGWNFEYKTNMVWLKIELKKPGSGYYVRGRHEFVFIATRGSFTPRDQHISPPIGSYFDAAVGEHSEKPVVLYDFIERMYPNCSYIELFARKERDEWTSWGNDPL